MVEVSTTFGLFRTATVEWWNDNAPRLGASLAYYTLFSIAPILLVCIAVAGLVFGADATRGQVVGQLRDLMGPEGATAIQALLQGASEKKAGTIASIVGGVTFVLAATGAFLELQAAFNTIWRVKANPSMNVTSFVLDRLRSFGLVVGIGFLLLVSLAVSAALAAFGDWLNQRAPGAPILLNILNIVLSLVVTTVLFGMLYRFVPDVELTLRDVIAGGFVTALLFTGGKYLIGLYLGHSSTASSYGAAGSVIVLLLWVYYSSQIVLLGAEFTRAYADRRGFIAKPQEFAVPDPDAPKRAS